MRENLPNAEQQHRGFLRRGRRALKMLNETKDPYGFFIDAQIDTMSDGPLKTEMNDQRARFVSISSAEVD